MGQEAQEAGESAVEAFKGQVFASALSAFDHPSALKRYYDLFPEKTEVTEEEYEIEEYEPESEADVLEMLNAARRAGAIQ